MQQKAMAQTTEGQTNETNGEAPGNPEEASGRLTVRITTSTLQNAGFFPKPSASARSSCIP